MTKAVASPYPTSGPRTRQADTAGFFTPRTREAQEKGPPAPPLPDSVGGGHGPPGHRPPARGRSALKLTCAGKKTYNILRKVGGDTAHDVRPEQDLVVRVEEGWLSGAPKGGLSPQNGTRGACRASFWWLRRDS